jgi:photosystem II stability/assembly factor-like uncharacterized protein
MTMHRRHMIPAFLPAILLLAAASMTAAPLAAQSTVSLDDEWLEAMRWRSIGPANMAGRITDVEGLPSPSKTFYVAAAAGGIWKTTNNGVTFRPVFDSERVVSMGDIAISPSDPDQVWAGTGEEDSRNSISPGGGVYKSVDGGLTWELMGLEATEHVGRIQVHPTNPNIVFVAALGALWRTNPERGLYRTQDGGETWEQVNFVSDRAGFVDVKFHPRDPNILFATSWERQRGPYYLESGGPGSALWKSSDGGDNWEKVTGGGLPETMLGKMNVAFAPSYPRVMYLMVEAEAPEGSDEENLNGLYRSDDGGETWERMNDYNSRPFYYSEVVVDPANPDRVYFSSLRFTEDGGRTMREMALAVHVDFHAIWVDPNDPDRIVLGNDGGIVISFDRGGNFLFPRIVPLGQFYNVSYDMDVPYNVCGGLQDNYTWCGPSRKADGEITNHDWFRVSGGDGFVSQQDPRNPNLVYSESQGGNMGRTNLVSGERTGFGRPDWRESYRTLQDSIALLWPDSTQSMPSEHRARIEDLQARATADSASLQLRYNWNTPYFLSPHDADIVYAGANRVLKSDWRGDDLYPISPDLTRADAEKIRISTETTGGITPDVTGAETFATIVSLAESPLRRGVLYAGTDDGNLWRSDDDGGTWTEITSATGSLVPDGTYVSRIEPSSHVAERVYVTFDNHRRGDFTPYVLASDDAGGTFRSIASDLPTGAPDFVHVIREDPVNPNLLFVGTDVGAYMSLDRGLSWQRFMTGLPTVPVHDLKIHPRDSELIAGTHGRSIWVVDIEPLQQHSPAVMAAEAHLFEPGPAFHYGSRPRGGEFTAQSYFVIQSAPYGTKIQYWLGEETEDATRIVVEDGEGNELWSTSGARSRGLHWVSWNQRGQEVVLPRSPSEVRDSIAIDHRLEHVADSLIDAGENREAVEEAVESLRDQEPGGGGGFDDDDDAEGLPFTASGTFVERAAEGPPIGAGGGGAGRGGAEDSLEDRITELVRGDQGGGRRGRRGGGGGLFPGRTEDAPLAEPGTYTVKLIVDGREYTQRFTLERDETAPES